MSEIRSMGSTTGNVPTRIFHLIGRNSEMSTMNDTSFMHQNFLCTILRIYFKLITFRLTSLIPCQSLSEQNMVLSFAQETDFSRLWRNFNLKKKNNIHCLFCMRNMLTTEQPAISHLHTASFYLVQVTLLILTYQGFKTFVLRFFSVC